MRAGMPIGAFHAPKVGNGLGGAGVALVSGSARPPVSASVHVPAVQAVPRAAAPLGLRAQDSLGLIKQRMLSNALRGGSPSGHPVAPPSFQGNKVPGMIR